MGLPLQIWRLGVCWPQASMIQFPISLGSSIWVHLLHHPPVPALPITAPTLSLGCPGVFIWSCNVFLLIVDSNTQMKQS